VLYHMDLQSIPKKRILYGLAQHASDKKEKNVLLLLSSKTMVGETLYESFISKNTFAIGDLFSLFPSCTPPLEALLAIVPSLPPRYYSVCCSPLEQLDEQKPFVRVAFAAVDYETPHLGRKFGMATRYLETIASPLLASSSSSEYVGLIPRVKVFCRGYGQAIGTEFHLPSNIYTPLILIGPGTGIAPFVGFLSHRKHQFILAKTRQQKDRSGSLSISEGTWRDGYEIERGDVKDGDYNKRESVTKMLNININTDDNAMLLIDVFYGCRCSTHDFIYHKEMEEFHEQGIIANYFTAFSREGTEKVYVQNRMKEEAVATRLSQLILEKSAAVYICGDGNDMVKDVQNALVEILSTSLNGDVAAISYLNEMKEKRRLLIDVWM
jgi:sulfite reductase alpha subunit-like flavoprotein